MRILHVTNIVSHHQLPLARSFARLVGADNFRFATTDPPSLERQRLGWASDVDEPWFIGAGENSAAAAEFERWWDLADVVICGERRFKRMKDRVDAGKLTFYMSERWWKPPVGAARLLVPRFSLMAAQFRKLAQSEFFHYLPMGGLAAGDLKRIVAMPGRMWEWGYFTDTSAAASTTTDRASNRSVLWAGRMLGWKRVDTLIRAFSVLQDKFPDARLTLVGDGPERLRLESLASKLIKHGNCEFRGAVRAPEVIKLMQQHAIYVLPSNGYEGWGAVVNEAMASGSAVVASKVTGAAASVITHGANGLLFDPGNWRSLRDNLDLLFHDPDMRSAVASAGQHTISKFWSPEVAATRFVALSEALLERRHATPDYTSGPMSPA